MKMLKKFPSPGVLFARGEGEGVRVFNLALSQSHAK
jgi:hypothetical protein